jgi:ADP-heptose:LPS heptosyltransferase
MTRWGVDAAKRLVVICPGARSHIKRWDGGQFARVADRLMAEEGVEVIFSGEPAEGELINEIREQMTHRAHTAVGSTTVTQVAALMQRSALVLTNDSASLHLACAVGAPVLALFGPTDDAKYGPTGARDRVLRRRLVCTPCEQALCRFHHECMRFVDVDEVYAAAQQLLGGER